MKLTNVRLVKDMVFPVVVYGYESWTLKKAESQRIDAFELWYWRRLLSPLDCKEIQLVHPKGMMLKLKLHDLATWCEELTLWKRP